MHVTIVYDGEVEGGGREGEWIKDTRFRQNVGQIGHKWNNEQILIFSDQISVLNSPEFVPFGVNLTHFGPNLSCL